MFTENVGTNLPNVRAFMIDFIPQTSYGFARISRSRLIEPTKEALRRACGKWIAKLFSFGSERMIHEPRHIGNFCSIIEVAESIRPVFGVLVAICQKQISVLFKQARSLAELVKSKTILGCENPRDIKRIEPAEMEKIARLAVDSYPSI